MTKTMVIISKAIEFLFSDTMVEVIMKNISKRKMISVMDAMLNAGLILFLRFSAMASVFYHVHE